ncbi:Uncharacterised protein [Starkeya nomas]|uniref:Phage tail assembly protein n=1 Tax=Starkeya nomas TaxID=2666134 RepID=A0A5S9R620_9HYPH|nr:phage tail assembly protein [Starkeya nomas]CAA0129351.1 Uncharacterised protein [Starkeya nomas]
MTAYTLIRPVDVAGKKIAELHFREPTFKDLRLFVKAVQTKDEMEAISEAICNLGTLTPAEVDALSVPDTAKVFGIIKGFFAAFEDEKPSKE